MNAVPLRVLLIEDNPHDAEYVDGLLQRNRTPSFQVHHCEQLAHGLAARVHHRFDAMLLDLGLPDSQGLETVAKAAGECDDTPIVVLTGADEGEQMGPGALQRGAEDYLCKNGLSREMLVRSIRYAVERRALWLEIVREQARSGSQGMSLFQIKPGTGDGQKRQASPSERKQLTQAYRQVLMNYVRCVEQGRAAPSQLVRILASRCALAGFDAHRIMAMHVQAISSFDALEHGEQQRLTQAARLCLLEIMGAVLDNYHDQLPEV